MTFTYDSTVSTDLAKVRLEIGDTVSTSALFTDEEINSKLSGNAGNVLKTAADLCGILSARYARQVSFSMDGQRVDLSDKAKMYRTMADDLRQRSTGGLRTMTTKKVDGYTSTTETEPNATSRDRRGSRGDFDVGRYS